MYKMSEEQQQKVFNNFKKVMDKQNSELINKDLYYHLNLNCNFVAHFNLQGFREAYSGENFKAFVDYFNSDSPSSQWLEAPEISAEFIPLNRSMVEYASQNH
ncbi:MAG TPA: hypothetical protein GX523_13695 [Desulfitobacterium dehalogenans]|uniref:Uncharacterized protein n=1 Tax=Desulfitobacterium dehalogenans TaxID=36854 RepID=A0A7C6Z5R4_9FIRM|nr:hypothetical protein [Desulfitobacterium dehalogenans]